MMTQTRKELEEQIAAAQESITSALRPYEAKSAVQWWWDAVRGIEDAINLMTIDWGDDSFEYLLYSFPVIQLNRYPKQFQTIRRRLIARFSEPFANRFCNLLTLGSTIAQAFAAHGFIDVGRGFQTVGTMIGYLQSRRRHFVALLHFLPSACRGNLPVRQSFALHLFLPIVEGCAAPMMRLQCQLMIRLAQEKLGDPLDSDAELAMLDKLFLEPERASIVEMVLTDEGDKILSSREPLLPDRLFSAAELRNDILCVRAAYAEFDLNNTEFGNAADLVLRLSVEYIERDFWVKISPEKLAQLMDSVKASKALRSALTCHSDSYMKCLSSYAPFVLIDGEYLSTVTLLSRFVYNWRARVLDSKKRFQIRSGFIFEDQVKGALERQGFKVHDIVRINRQEFDVVATLDEVIWNVQCKNNFVDVDRVDSDAATFAKYNCRLVRYYEKALIKERNREHLLKEKLALCAIEHVVVSRFPVVTNNPRIVVFSRIEQFHERIRTLGAG